MQQLNRNEVILIYPKTGIDTPETISLPLSLLLISARLVKDQRFVITIIDQRIERDWGKKLKNKLNSSNTLCVGLSTMTGSQIGFALKAAELVREHACTIPLVWGGVHPTLTPLETMKDPLVDIVVIGEGEETFPDLVNAFYNKTNLGQVPGIMFKDDSGNLIKTNDRFYSNLNGLPEIPYHLVDVNKYFYEIIGNKALPMLFSRGCVHRCGFCYRSNFPSPKWRPISLENAIKEIKTLMRLGAQTIIPLDDNFFVDMKRIPKLCDLLRKNNITLKFHVNCRIDYVDEMTEEYLRFLKECGFVSWDFGVESGSQKTLDFITKDLNVDQILRVNRKLKQAGISATYSFMGGFPEETYSDLRNTLDIMFKLIEEYPEAHLSPIKIYTPFPSTALIKDLPENYFKYPSSLREWAKFDYNTPHITWHSKRETRRLEQISYYSLFIDPKRLNTVFGKTSFLRRILKAFGNLSRIRLKKSWYSLPIDFYLMKLFYLFKKSF